MTDATRRHILLIIYRRRAIDGDPKIGACVEARLLRLDKHAGTLQSISEWEKARSEDLAEDVVLNSASIGQA